MRSGEATSDTRPERTDPCGMPRVGLDLGSLYVKAVLLADSGREILDSYFKPHKGDPAAAAREVFQRFGVLDREILLGVTGANAKLLADLSRPLNPVRALRAAVLASMPGTRNIIDAGGCSVTLIRLNQDGQFQSYTTNPLCAAGTGSFLDEQAERLGVSYDEIQRFERTEDPPSIATRCAVFAKTDLIHRQQEGYSREEMWSGLCKGMTDTFMQILLRGGKLDGKTAVTGGVALNDEIMRWLKKKYGADIERFPEPVFAQALGCALEAPSEAVGIPADLSPGRKGPAKAAGTRPSLVLRKTRYPDMTVPEEWVDDLGTEVRIHRPFSGLVGAYLGIDVGSTSTKITLVDEDEEAILDLYRKTSGDPTGATRMLFAGLTKVERRKNAEFRILGAASTGSGRRLVGKLVGADLIVNEITAHTTGTLKVDPEIETIFEIGGQDSKYVHLKNGRMSQCNMNYVCAAGTGSFIEEQANKLGFSVKEVGDVVTGLAPPPSSERCTVFMEQDLHDLLARGHSREETLAAVMYSVAQNYLTKVVGKRPVSPKKIFFQGATARNRALVAAFENILDREIVVSPLCHIMGAYGAALLVKRDQRTGTDFKGLDILNRNLSLSYEQCSLCANHCKITWAKIEGMDESPSWGYMCGRDPDDSGKKKVPGFEPFKRRRAIISRMGNVKVEDPIATLGIPRCLVNYTYLPLWKKFLGELGFRVRVSRDSDEEVVREGLEAAGADYCYPVKVAHGHTSVLLRSDDIDLVFLPHMIGFIPPKSSYPVGYFCPYVQSLPSVAKRTFNKEMIAPVVDFHWTLNRVVSELYETVGRRFGISRRGIRRAWVQAVRVQNEFTNALQEEGRRVVEDLEGEGVVIVGRPYNTLDEKVSLNIPYKLAENFDLTVLPIDMVPFEPDGIDGAFKMFWNYGKVILNGIKFVRENPNWHSVFLSSFGCGPDSYLLSYAEEMTEDKPSLILELDEHGSDAGYQTRIEAFMDAVRSAPRKTCSGFDFSIMKERGDMDGRVVWIPPMHPVGTRLFAAAFRRHGYNAEALPPETPEILETGRSLVRGSECLPTALTIGNFVHKMREIKGDPGKHALFMATSDGPCRLGQYIVLHRLILDRIGYKDAAIVAPSSYNQYAGLPEAMRPFVWKMIVMSDILYKIGCKLRPYERIKGETDRSLEEGVLRMEEAVSRGDEVTAPFQEVVSELARVEVEGPPKPLVGIVGEIYVRCNHFSNDNVVRAVEDAGGEAWLAPLSEWFLYTGFMQKWHARHRGDLKGMLRAYLKDTYLHRHERRIYEGAVRMVGDRHEPQIEEIIDRATRYIPINFGGEATLTIGRATLFAERGARLIVNVAPFTCMPGTITTALFNCIQSDLGVPVVSLFFDGMSGESGHIRTYIENLPEAARHWSSVVSPQPGKV